MVFLAMLVVPRSRSLLLICIVFADIVLSNADNVFLRRGSAKIDDGDRLGDIVAFKRDNVFLRADLAQMAVDNEDKREIERIVGGQDAGIGEYPFYAHAAGTHLCGGSL